MDMFANTLHNSVMERIANVRELLFVSSTTNKNMKVKERRREIENSSLIVCSRTCCMPSFGEALLCARLKKRALV